MKPKSSTNQKCNLNPISVTFQKKTEMYLKPNFCWISKPIRNATKTQFLLDPETYDHIYIYIHTDIDTEREGGITWYERESLDCSYGVMGDLYNGCSEEWKQ